METKTYLTPNYDKALEALGWIKFENNPVYARQVRRDRYEICFHVDFYGMQAVTESWVADGKITFDHLCTSLVNEFEAAAAKTITYSLTYEILLMLTADFYHHNRDLENGDKYKNLYEQLSHRKY
jgi:hypothetical protein